MLRHISLHISLLLLVAMAIAGIGGCSSKQSFGFAGRPGDPVVLNVGWHPDLKRQNLTVTIQPCLGDLIANAPDIVDNAVCKMVSGPPVIYTSANSELHAVVNMVLDPLSQLIYNRETWIPGETVAQGEFIELFATGDDKEYLETSVMLDIPVGIPTDSYIASITFSDSAGEILNPQFVEIVHSPAYPLGFRNWDDATITNTQLRTLERKDYKTVTFSGMSGVPYALQVKMTHDPGKLYVVNPRGDIKSLNWADDGTQLTVIITPAWLKGTAPSSGETLGEFVHYKFYVAGDVVNSLLLPVDGAEGFDINGNSVAVSGSIN